MKNLKISVKLIGGFLLTAIIVLFVGITSLIEQSKLNKEAKTLAQEAMPAIQNLLIIKSEAAAIASLMRTLLTPYASADQRKQAHQSLLDHRTVYGEAKERFMALPLFDQVEQEWQTFSTSIGEWVAVNNKAVELSKELIASDMTNPTRMSQHMSDFEIAHKSLLANLGKLLAFNLPFDGGTDSTACSLGKWMANMDTTNPEIVALVEQLRPVHDDLHAHVARVKELVGDGQTVSARTIMTEQLYPTSERIFDFVHQMNTISSKAYDHFVEMNKLLLEDAEAHQVETFAALDAIVARAIEHAGAIAAETDHVAKRGRLITLVGLSLGVALAVILGITLTLLITRPLFKGVELAQAMASGDMTKTMDVDQKDEIGTLAKSLNAMAKNLRTMIGDVSKGVLQVDDSSNQLAVISNQMSSGSADTAARSSQVAAAAEQMSANQESVAAAMEEASVNVNMVASAAEEMNATINEIAQNSGRAKDITAQAVGQSKKASERVDELGRAADEINKVTEAITEISEQTNLLALNATIEAARAGEAGKGFAVVANEIKDLAKQTAEATLDIKNKIQSIQRATGITVEEINQISSVIADVDQIVATIATAVEEQTATTREIAENVAQVSQGIAEVNENVAQSSTTSSEIASDIAAVNGSANEMNASSSQVKERAEALSDVANQLKQMMARFTV